MTVLVEYMTERYKKFKFNGGL